MFTLFDLFELIAAVAGIALCATVGYTWFGWIGAIPGGAIGYVIGLIVGRLPFMITFHILKRDLKRCDVATLRSRLDSQYFIAHLIITELVVRGEPVESFRDYVSELLRSDSSDKRRFGERVLRMWPETAQPPAPNAHP